MEEKEKIKKEFKKPLLGCLFYLGLFAGATYFISNTDFETKKPSIEEGYMNPEKTEIYEKDVYKENNHSEAILRNDSKDYVIKMNEKGNLFAEEYQEPAQSGSYAFPNKLEIISQDNNKNPGKETILKYRNENYSLKKDSLGNPDLNKIEAEDGNNVVPIPMPVTY